MNIKVSEEYRITMNVFKKIWVIQTEVRLSTFIGWREES